jgi:hypothetical protein
VGTCGAPARPRDAPEPGAAGDRARVDQAERGQRRAQGEEHMGQVAAPAERQPAAGRGDRQPRQVRQQRPQQPPGTLGSELQRHPQPEQAVERTDRAQVA